MKPNPQNKQEKFNKKPNQSHGKPGANQKYKSKQKKTVSIHYKCLQCNKLLKMIAFFFALKENKPNKPEIRKMIRQQKAAEAEAERLKIKAEKEQRIKAYKKQRLEKTKAISKRTQRGQPLMKDRMQLLLKQIEEMKKR